MGAGDFNRFGFGGGIEKDEVDESRIGRILLRLEGAVLLRETDGEWPEGFRIDRNAHAGDVFDPELDLCGPLL